MPNIYTVEETTDPILNSSILAAIRANDEAILLPGAGKSKESGAYKNTVFRLDGQTPNIPYQVFGEDWSHGVSLIRIPTSAVHGLIATPQKRKVALRKLSDAIPNELVDRDIEVGPHLVSSNDRDTMPWSAGFDSGGCSCGLYMALERAPPTNGSIGASRVHETYYLVAKAGGGRASQEFSSRLSAAARSGASLNALFEHNGDLGEHMLERVRAAGRRNRARILVLAAQTLGLDHCITTVSDQVNHADDPHKNLITDVDTQANTLRRPTTTMGEPGTHWIYAAGAVDSTLSQGLVTCSNVADGYVMLSGGGTSCSLHVRNSASDCIPFGSRKIKTTADIITQDISQTEMRGHVDRHWLVDHFGWKRHPTGTNSSPAWQSLVDMEPVQLWGTHEPESWLRFARELAVDTAPVTRLHPEIVVLGGTEASKLRAAERYASGGR